MAGDWIKMRADLFTHPKVVRISSALKADTLRTVGGLMSVWCLFDAHSIDGTLEGYSSETLDSHLRWEGFAAAMIAVGWLEADGESLVLPRFEDHNGQSAKRRAQDADRKKDVRKTSASDADKKRTREEKRREEKKEQEPPVVPQGDEEALLTAYHSILPKCQHVSVLNDKRRKRIAAAVKLAKSVCRDQGWPYEALNFWTAYFTECATDPWMRGDVPYRDNPKWKQNLDLLLAEDRFAGVMDRAIEALIRSAE
jgi:hypothetical protein